MAKIQVLDKQIAELIAAGEVVERPSSVVKELVENSIDAGASAITVEIQNGGVTYIRVTDNGSGIQRDDIPTAFLRHATSKVHTQEDLDHIGTLGFRGEALASIAAVSKVELLTCAKGEMIGSHYRIEGGEEVDMEDAGCPEGTTFIIRDLFYNTPARIKFLKKDVTEANAVAGVLDRIALSHPEVSIKFIRSGKEVLLTPGDGDLLSDVYAVFGRDFAKNLLPVDYTLHGIRVHGYISKPTAARPNRSMQYFFINSRVVRSRTAMAALEESCKGSVMVGRFPASVLHLEVALEGVDVNVHPAKIEVRFVNERPVFDAVYHACKNALQKEDDRKEMELQSAAKPPIRILPVTPPAKLEQTKLTDQMGGKSYSRREDDAVPSFQMQPMEKGKPSLTGSEDPLFVSGKKLQEKPPVYQSISYIPSKEESCSSDVDQNIETSQNDIEPVVTQEAEEIEEPAIRVIGEAFSTYIILEVGKELFLIDKHAAHERLLYEQIKKDATINHQMLLVPVPVTLEKSLYDAVLDHLSLLSQAGFETEDFGDGCILVRSAPLELDGADVELLVTELAGRLVTCRRDLIPEQLEWIYHSVACRAAVKAGDKNSPKELYELAVRAFEEDVRYCPHGRPIAIRLTQKELEKQFGRIQ
ncbi:DNA mismatch repair endonuclease MutL [Solibaculum mannosilyticum]|uniref:DNA mismatch repair protein MutL n=1 Tax=Solibaculum mannosilyticum TaxID=2780922 RepID=A0A7I8D0K4_9FIRM|nr:DNA mismatch repair endonuclease MutL [Solibaculum mannosilyticum]BCI60308.1 DNA mismatch repair protein [Solibaculum mannosilyticum]